MDEFDVTGPRKLRLTKIPENFGADQLKLLCQPFGQVVDVILSEEGVAYLEMSTKKQRERVHDSLKANDFGIFVEKCPSLKKYRQRQDKKKCFSHLYEKEKPKLRLINVPDHINAYRLLTLCESYGSSVVNVMQAEGGFAYVEMNTEKDFERAYEGLKNNDLGITVEKFPPVREALWESYISRICATSGEALQSGGNYSTPTKKEAGLDDIPSRETSKNGEISNPKRCRQNKIQISEVSSSESSLEERANELEWRRESAELKRFNCGSFGEEELEWRRKSSEMKSSSKSETDNVGTATPGTAQACSSADVIFDAECQSEANGAERVGSSAFIDREKKIPKYVCITGYYGPSLLWVRSLENQLNEAYLQIVDKANTIGTNSEELENLPCTGDLVITNSAGNTFRRAQVLHVTNERNINVKFLDFGPQIVRKLTQLRQYPEKDLPKTTDFIFTVPLFQVPNFTLNSEARDLLNHYIRNSTQFQLFCLKRKPVQEFVLKEVSTRHNLNELLREISGKIYSQNERVIENPRKTLSSSLSCLSDRKKEQAKKGDGALCSNSLTKLTQNDQKALNSDNKNLVDYGQTDAETKDVSEDSARPAAEVKSELLYSQDIQWNMLPNDDYVGVYITDNSFLKFGIVSCINLKKLKAIERFNQEFDKYARTSSEAHTPRVSEICLALNEDDQKWYRAEVIAKLSEDLTLKFIDLGCIRSVQSQSIRKYPTELLRPCHTSTCIIRGLPQDMDEHFLSSLTKFCRLGGKLILNRVETISHLKLSFINVDLTDLF